MHKLWVALAVCALASCVQGISSGDAPFFLRSRATKNHLTKEAAADKVSSLPGWGNLQDDEFDIYSGYITVDAEAGRSLFYVFVESQDDPAADPLVLWLNGGPGCSSLAGGFMSELGPFFPTTRGNLQANDYSWNTKANVLFVEAPAFVGFSYSNTTADRDVGDKRTAEDNHEFLLRWFDRFPHYRSHKFWLSGESYAGHYVPTLALEILRGNEGADAPPINLKGLLVGNAWTDAQLDNHGALEFWFSHGLISFTAYKGIKKYCDFGSVGPLQQEFAPTLNATAVNTPKCDKFVSLALDQIRGINIYDIFADVCLSPDASNPALALGRALKGHPLGLSTAAAVLKNKYDPCIDNEVETYLNREDVQRALHVVPGLAPKRWTGCTHEIQYSREDLLSSMLPVWHHLLEADLELLVYSGDVDAIVPVTGTRAWIHGLALEVAEPWRAWTSASRQVGGWTVRYSHGLTFATVRGAGHMVPYTQPERALHLFNSWVHHQRL
ncbi:Serine carboxypeptidase-like 22 [Auxenochlorella protothecoides]|uniref:Carboxypeptidase n=2 Tax=Auxenochlorella protothecoides TaxID=3075 RepID=A0A087SC47_AUXPR|nr:Serine carboxypeptidase-like 22 [Auxenochlorella protothecoides]KFM23301.1 Serine carboxypeptidase-like 22 [Auxenochlorella protothecoides]RMZ55131.1 hypothetical protein APUTEX25_005409 [Auxenochlorella protothecoides]|eukprot:RMZ55131.1 hypothetical protein APUTEX25_005409 [Auxenochlorella protothecoides]